MRRVSIVSIAAIIFAARAAQADPEKLVPPPPPPWDEGLSTSGVDIVAPRASEHASMPEHAMHTMEIRALEDRVAELERERREKPSVPAWVEWLKPSLLLQPQLVWNFYNAAASPNASNGLLPPGIGSNDVTATSNGNTTNPDFFRLRRARLKLDFLPTEYARFVFEIEPVPRDPTIPGSGTIARQIEAIARVPISRKIAFDVGAGSFEVPFGGEWLESHGDRPFIERSYFQQNIFPGDFDLGAHVGLEVGRHLGFELAAINGRTFGELDHGGSLDLNRPKDGVLRARWSCGGLDIGLAGYVGEGQLVDATNLIFKQYTREAADVDVAFRRRVGRLGVFRAFGEFFYGANMDRGVLDPGNLPVIPIDLSQNVADRDELGALVRVDQEFGRVLSLGARYDVYSPDVNLSNDVRHTIGAVVSFRIVPELTNPETHVGLVPRTGGPWLEPRIQVNLEYAHAIDTIRASGPQGDTKEIDTLSVVLQGRL
jgi:hypothetical protein